MAKHNFIPLPAKAKDITGRTFGRLTALGPVARAMPRQTFVWLCMCTCGAETTVRLDSLTTGKTTSCGCFQSECVSTHRAVSTPEYRCWAQMKSRCDSPTSHNYQRYGGRGIGYAPAWSTFEAFLADAGKRPSPKHSLDRMDNEGDYTPKNCRWATKKEQSRNTRTNLRLTFLGITRTAVEWSEVMGMKYHTLINRIARGWTTERALTEPVRKRVRKTSHRS